MKQDIMMYCCSVLESSRNRVKPKYKAYYSPVARVHTLVLQHRHLIWRSYCCKSSSYVVATKRDMYSLFYKINANKCE